jgi:hypothetical protein
MGEQLTGEDLLPGLSLPVAVLFEGLEAPAAESPAE